MTPPKSPGPDDARAPRSEEAFCSSMRRAARLSELGHAHPARAAYLEASRACPTRAEPLYEIARQYRAAGKFDLAYLFAKRAAGLPAPEAGSILVAADVYRWRALDELALCAYDIGRYEEAFGLTGELLERSTLPDTEVERLREHREKCRPWTRGQRGEYRADVVNQVRQRTAGRSPNVDVTLTITSCRRPHLFERAVNSFLTHCTDLERIGRWICIDNGTSEEARARMRELYPFFEFVFTEPPEYRHGDAMNHLMEAVQGEFWLHIEDDWQFVDSAPLVERGIDILADDDAIAQVAFNRNYAELYDHRVTGGHIRHTNAGLRYRLHEQIEPGTPEWEHYLEVMPPKVLTTAVWPHFTCRPSLMRTEAMRSVGHFRSERERDFEFEFAERFAAAGFRTAFFDRITCVHTGRLTHHATSDGRDSAYDLVTE